MGSEVTRRRRRHRRPRNAPSPATGNFPVPNFPVQRIGGLCPSPNQGSLAGSRDFSADLSADMSAVLSAVGLAEVEGLSKVEGATCPWIGWDQSGKMMGAG